MMAIERPSQTKRRSAGRFVLAEIPAAPLPPRAYLRLAGQDCVKRLSGVSGLVSLHLAR